MLNSLFQSDFMVEHVIKNDVSNVEIQQILRFIDSSRTRAPYRHSKKMRTDRLALLLPNRFTESSR